MTPIPMATLITADPPAVRPIIPTDGRHAFRFVDIVRILGDPPIDAVVIHRVRVLFQVTAFEVLVSCTDTAHPVNPIATSIVRESGAMVNPVHADATIRGAAVHCVQVVPVSRRRAPDADGLLFV